MKLKGFIGEKSKMSQVPDRHGRVLPITEVRVAPNTVVKVMEKKALVAYGSKRKIPKSLSGILKNIKGSSPKGLKELDIGNEKVTEGEIVKISDCFSRGDLLDITGVSKGKGFAGVVKRHGFAGGPKTHGQSDRHRAPGSIGAATTPGRVFKGLRMAGRMGGERVTIKGLEVVAIDEEANIIEIKGAVPGNVGNLLILKRSLKKKKAYHEPEIPVMPQIGKEEPVEGQVEEGSQGETQPTPTKETTPLQASESQEVSNE